MDSKTKRGVIGGGVFLVALIAVLAALLVGAKGDASDTKDQLASAQSSARAQQARAKASQAANAKTIQSQSARLLVLDPPLWSKAVAGQMYLKIVSSGNARVDVYNKIDNATFKQAKAFARDIIAILSRQAQEFQTGKWPTNAKSAIAALVDDIADDIDSYNSQLRATSLEDLNAVSFTSGKAAQKARIVLGLPPAR